jgi:hypothetical protein
MASPRTKRDVCQLAESGSQRATMSDSTPAVAADKASPPPLIYRFRPLRRLLEDGELARQEIYFASPAELNDPMEGFRDLFWSGDRIAWENLFRHYLRCLNWAILVYRLGGDEQPLGWSNIPVVGPWPSEPGSAKMESMLREINADFLGDSVVSRLIDFLDGRSIPVRRDELRGYMRSLHDFALAIVSRRHELSGMCAESPTTGEMLSRAHPTLVNLDKMIGMLRCMSEDKQDQLTRELFGLFDQVAADMSLTMVLGLQGPSWSANRDFIIRSFGEEFVDQLDRLLYPEWRVACFLTDAQDSALWGTYGDSHRGACLIFKPNQDGRQASMPLTRVNGYGSGGTFRSRVNHQLHRVHYANRFPPVDFFRSIGNLSGPVLRSRWHADPEGRVSVCAFESEDEWRKAYWKEFYPGATTKLIDWEREREFRLLLQGFLVDFSDVEQRKATYDFASLVGIVFGMKTPVAARLEIAKIATEKCRQAGRSDFKFYEARYSEVSGKIVHVELGLMVGSVGKAVSAATAQLLAARDN